MILSLPKPDDETVRFLSDAMVYNLPTDGVVSSLPKDSNDGLRTNELYTVAYKLL